MFFTGRVLLRPHSGDSYPPAGSQGTVWRLPNGDYAFVPDDLSHCPPDCEREDFGFYRFDASEIEILGMRHHVFCDRSFDAFAQSRNATHFLKSGYEFDNLLDFYDFISSLWYNGFPATMDEQSRQELQSMGFGV